MIINLNGGTDVDITNIINFLLKNNVYLNFSYDTVMNVSNILEDFIFF
jgi:hypothetical protein